MATSSASQQQVTSGLSVAPSRKPKKSILKKPHLPHEDSHKEASFDEMNILATYHPADKDYGHMKIDEPNTPYRYDGDTAESLDADDVTERLAHVGDDATRRPRHDSGRSEEDFDDDHYMSPEQREKAKQFRDHRKEHYNMKEQLKKAKELLAKEMAELEDE